VDLLAFLVQELRRQETRFARVLARILRTYHHQRCSRSLRLPHTTATSSLCVGPGSTRLVQIFTAAACGMAKSDGCAVIFANPPLESEPWATAGEAIHAVYIQGCRLAYDPIQCIPRLRTGNNLL
jgi:hypothetical protein